LNYHKFKDDKVTQAHTFSITKLFLTDLWREWYVNNIKICPSYVEDIFDEIIFAYWCQDDVSLDRSTMQFNTQGFDKSSQDRLVMMLRKLGYTSAHTL
jgi:hypothetical protein